MAPIFGYQWFQGMILTDNVYKCGGAIVRRIPMLSVPLRWCHADIRHYTASTNAKVPAGN